MIQKYRRAINPPYSKQDLPVIFLTLFFVLTIPLSLIFLQKQNIIKSQAAMTWQLVGTHPQAILQPTSSFGRNISVLVAYNNKLYAGYGDANANTGPIAITPFNPTTNQFESVAWTLDTEEISTFRNLGGKLYAVSHDTKAGDDYASGEPWESKNPVTYEHVHDMATLTGSDLWISGQQAPAAVLHRSTDGGATWQEAQRYSTGVCCSRYYFIGVYNGRLYVQGASSGTPHTPQARSRVFNGTSWSDGPNLLPNGGPGWHPMTFAGKMVYQTSAQFYADRKYLMSFDGTTVRQVLTSEVLDFSIENNELYILRLDGRIQKTTDLATWTDVMSSSPTNYYSIGVLNGVVYVGTKDATLYKLDTSGTGVTPTLPPPATPTIALSPTTTVAPSSNLLLNSSFETNNNGTPASWSSGTWDNTVSRTGGAAMKVTGPATATYSWQKSPLKPSTTYTVQGYIKTSAILTTESGASLRYANVPGSVEYTQSVNGTKDWTFVQKVFTTPADWTSSSRLDLFSNFSTGTVWFDDVALCEGTCSTTLPTNTPVPTTVLSPTPTRTPTPIPPTTDTINPIVSITNPQSGATVQRRENVTISATASDNIGVDHVTFSVDGNVSTVYASPYTYSWSVSGKPSARYTITATAYDAANNSASQSITITSNR